MKVINCFYCEFIDDIQGIEWVCMCEEQEDDVCQVVVEDVECNCNFCFIIIKWVDIVSMQMLNLMKVGDIFLFGMLIIYKCLVMVVDGILLVFMIQKICLIDYQLQVLVMDMMIEMMEEWICEFGLFVYVYKNLLLYYVSGNVGQVVVKIVIQGMVWVFMMKNIGLFFQIQLWFLLIIVILVCL